MALQRPTKLNPLIHLLTGLIDDTLINAVSQSKITGLVAALLAKAGLADNQTFTGTNTFNNPVTVGTATLGTHAATLAQVNAAVSGVSSAVHAPAASVAAARAIDASTLTDGELINIQGTAGVWKWSASSTAADDGVNVIAPTNAGTSGRFVFFLDQAVDGVTLGGAQNITGVKTFTNSPIVPTATTSGQAANLGNISSAIATEATNRDAAIAAEATARANAITTEANARSAADATLTSNVNTNTNAIATANSNITANTNAIATANTNIANNTSAITTNTNAIAAINATLAKIGRVVYLDQVAAGATTLTVPGALGLPAIIDDDTVQLWVKGVKWRKDTGGSATNRQFTVTAGGASLTVFALEEVSDIEIRFVA